MRYIMQPRRRHTHRKESEKERQRQRERSETGWMMMMGVCAAPGGHGASCLSLAHARTLHHNKIQYNKTIWFIKLVILDTLIWPARFKDYTVKKKQSISTCNNVSHCCRQRRTNPIVSSPLDRARQCNVENDIYIYIYDVWDCRYYFVVVIQIPIDSARHFPTSPARLINIEAFNNTLSQ